MRRLFGVVATFLSLATASDVLKLTGDNFESTLKEHEGILVKFFAPWCGHCKKLAPEFEAAATALKEKGSKVVLADVDATEHKDLADRFEVQGYPTLKFFRGELPQDYTGGRSKDAIVAWVEKRMGPAVQSVSTMKEAEDLLEKNAVVYVATVKSADSDAAKVYTALAEGDRDLGVFVMIVDGNVKEEDQQITVLRRDEGNIGSVKLSDDPSSVKNFVETEKLPFFGGISGDNYNSYFTSGKEMVWVVGTEEDFNKLAPAVRTAAKETRSEANWVWLDSVKFQSHATGSLDVHTFPAVVVQMKTGRYVYPPGEPMESSRLSAFFSDARAGKIPKSIKSEPVPEQNDGPVKIVVGKTFGEMVFTSDKDVLLEVYAPWCGHCKKLEPVYTEFAEAMAAVKHLVVAKMDGTANEAPNEDYSWSGFPTIYFTKAGEKKPILFDGLRTAEGLFDFVKKWSSHKIEERIRDEL